MHSSPRGKLSALNLRIKYAHWPPGGCPAAPVDAGPRVWKSPTHKRESNSRNRTMDLHAARPASRGRDGGRWAVLTLKAAGLLDLDAGEVVRPGVLRIDGELIAGVGGGSPDGDVLDLGELILLPGLMDMEVNLLMGGRGETAAYSPVQDDPPLRMLRAVGNARRTLRAGFTTVRNLDRK